MSQLYYFIITLPKLLNPAVNSHIALPETVIIYRKWLYCLSETVISPLRAIILSIDYLGFEIKERVDKQT